MKKFRIYVTNNAQAITALKEQNIQVANGTTYIELQIEPERKMEVITLLNRANVVLYDIEEA